ncbi:hypothetical protein FHR23_000348 [Stakelama sediminis]|uniref:Uncharacterized protein n=1 Tax=Stakelama sediminis TaxID=463200 RepID=A0A840YUT8_9SPHN|nr:hypothetical protein [Stakelama sediminis]MBB5717441.1 hypothetical protein [Stakelama sediminis]
MKRALVMLLTGTIVSGMAAAYAGTLKRPEEARTLTNADIVSAASLHR